MALVEYQDDLFGGDRSSSIPVGLFVKFEVSRENRDKANLARMQRLERDRIRQEKAELQYQTTQERRAKVLQRSGQSKALMQRHNQDTGREVRACKEAWAAERSRQKQTYHEVAKERTVVARGLDSKLDAFEAMIDEEERREATKARKERAKAAHDFRTNLAAVKKANATTSRVTTQRNVSSKISEVALSKRTQAEEKRLAYERGKAQRQLEEEERMRRVAKTRAQTMAAHAAAARAKEEMLLRKQEEGAQADRTANLLIMEERAMHLRENQHRRLSQFSSRYVGSTQAEMFDSSQFRHYYMMDKAAEQEIAHANSELFKRIRATEAREDTDITDEDAGFQREAAAAASKARRAAEARKIAAQNAALQARLKNIKALTDNSIHDEAAGDARLKAAQASKTRREEEAAKLKAHNAEMQAKLLKVRAATDDGDGDKTTFGKGLHFV